MGHNHYHSENKAGENLKIAFYLNLGFTILEIIGGIYTNSVAILSDAIHDLGDSLSLGTAWYLSEKSTQGSDSKFSFGYARFSLLGALINSVVLLVGSVFVIKEAVERLYSPEPADAMGMIAFAIIGVLVNSYAAWKVSKGNTLNERVVAWHLVEDVLGWFAVLIAAVLMLFWDIPFLDPVLSILITVYILWNVVKRLKETLFIFLQGIPDDVSVTEIERVITNIKGVKSVHHTHVWSLDGESHVFSAHLKFDEDVGLNNSINIKNQVKSALKPFNFKHYTLETEWHNENCELEVE